MLIMQPIASPNGETKCFKINHKREAMKTLSNNNHPNNYKISKIKCSTSVAVQRHLIIKRFLV